MTRLEFIRLENLNEMKDVFNALATGMEYKVAYTDKEGNKQTKTIANKGRLYVGSNFSISLSIAEDGKCYLGVDYLSSDDRRNNFDAERMEFWSIEE